MENTTTTSGVKKITPWILATRPKTLMAAVIPLLVGSMTPPIPYYELDFLMIICSLLAGVSLTIATNLINDALDFKKGADTEERIGPIRVTKEGLLSFKTVLRGGFFFLVLTALFAIPLCLKGGWPLVLIVLLSIMCSYLYTGGPYPLSYKGLGELFVILFYGIVATTTSYYLQTGFIDLNAFIASLQIGSLATVLIAINNLRDIEEDRKTGKMTLAARFGVTFGKVEITCLVLAPFVLAVYWYIVGQILAFLLPMTSFLIAVNLLRGIYKHPPSRLYNRFLGEASLLLTVYGLLLILGFRL